MSRAQCVGVESPGLIKLRVVSNVISGQSPPPDPSANVGQIRFLQLRQYIKDKTSKALHKDESKLLVHPH